MPSCPDWNVGQLLRHLGSGHRWVETIIRTRTTQPLPDEQVRAVSGYKDEDPAVLADLARRGRHATGGQAARHWARRRGVDPGSGGDLYVLGPPLYARDGYPPHRRHSGSGRLYRRVRRDEARGRDGSGRDRRALIGWQVDFCGLGGYVDQMGYDLSLTRAGLEPTVRVLATVRELDMIVIHTREGTARICPTSRPANAGDRGRRQRRSAPSGRAFVCFRSKIVFFGRGRRDLR